MRLIGHAVIIVFLTLLTQIGGLAWIASWLFPRRLLAFLAIYAGLSLSMIWIAPQFGREALTCWDRGPVQMQSVFYCALNRNYMDPEMRAVLDDAAESVAQAHPGTITLVLDASFPLFDGFPLLPHLSHDDGGQADLALFYQDETGFLPGIQRSPIGYFAFEHGPTSCPDAFPTLRWDMGALQPYLRDLELEPDRMRSLTRALSQDARVGRIFLEPHLVDRLGVAHPRIGFQGCRAARHDDHIHVQL